MKRGGVEAAILVSLALHAAVIVAVLWESERSRAEPQPAEPVAIEVELTPARLLAALEPAPPVLPSQGPPEVLRSEPALAGDGEDGPAGESEARPDEADAAQPPGMAEDETPADTPEPASEAEAPAPDEDPAETVTDEAAATTAEPPPRDSPPAEEPAAREPPSVDEPAAREPASVEEEETAAQEVSDPEEASGEARETAVAEDPDPAGGAAPEPSLADAGAPEADDRAGPAGTAPSADDAPARLEDSARTAAARSLLGEDIAPPPSPLAGPPTTLTAPPEPERRPSSTLWPDLARALGSGPSFATGEAGSGTGGGEEVAYTEAVRAAVAPGFQEAMQAVRGSGAVLVEVVIARTGRVISSRIVESSGDAVLDAASLAAARGARYPPLPPAVNRDRLTVHIPLRVR